MNLTREEAKRKVLKDFSSIDLLWTQLTDGIKIKLLEQAANLMNESNLARIKELTADKKEYESMLDAYYMKSKNQLLCIKELETDLYIKNENISHRDITIEQRDERIKKLEDGLNTLVNDIELCDPYEKPSLVKAKQLLCTE